MTWPKFILRSLVHHARLHLGAFLGAAVGAAILTGALLVGDSVRTSLKAMALARLGNISSAVASGDRLFRAALAKEIEPDLRAPAAAALQLLGTASNPDSALRANKVHVIGVSNDFWKLAKNPLDFPEIESNSVYLNAPLAELLKVKTGDSVLIRVPKVSSLSRDAPLAPEEDSSVALRLDVAKILTDDQFGRFGLQASQVAPFNAFVSLDFLERKTGATNQANLLLAGGSFKTNEPDAALRNHFQLADAQLQLRPLTNLPFAELRTSRIFMDSAVANVATTLSTNAQPVFTYFVNELRSGSNSTPYSMVTGIGAPIVPPGMRNDEILINSWLAEDLDTKPGAELELTYYVVGLMRELVERTNRFRIRAILPMQLPAADPTLMPDFPGVANAQNCRDWDTGFPIQTSRIRDKDEKYWHDYRGTPKAFITFAAAQNLWSNRFGVMTSVRYPIHSTNDLGQLRTELRKNLNPENLGLSFLPVREQALAASSQSQDFGQLFLGFSFFLIAAALILMSLLFRFGLEQRGMEIGALLALGITPKQVRRYLLFEGAIISLLGSIVGLIGAIAYAKGMVYALSTIWSEAVGSASLDYYAEPTTLIIGAVAATLVATFTIWLSLRKEARRPARELLQEGLIEQATISNDYVRRSAWSRIFKSSYIAITATILGLALVGYAITSKDAGDADLFFSAGALILIAGLAFCSWGTKRMQKSKLANRISLSGMGVRNVTRQPRRSRSTIGLLACGAFLIASVGAFRLDSEADAAKPTSGTGGFSLIGESTLPVTQNLNGPAGQNFYGLIKPPANSAKFVQFRVREGEDASCLNLNRAQRPRILGVNPDSLKGRFTFDSAIDGHKPDEGWALLSATLPDGSIPAVGDAASIKYALGKNIGDTLDYETENGRTVKLRIVGAVANSILQGSLIISESNFVTLFPSESGYRMFLVATPSNAEETTRDQLSKAMQNVGLEITSASKRLARFNAVQNTYLGAFQVLGGLGLLLGTAGLGVVLLRNLFERRGELGLLQAVGFRRSQIKKLALSEHAALLCCGLLVGVVAAFFAVLPNLLHPRGELPFYSLGLTLLAVLLLGLICTFAAATFALRGRLIDSLRNE